VNAKVIHKRKTASDAAKLLRCQSRGLCVTAEPRWLRARDFPRKANYWNRRRFEVEMPDSLLTGDQLIGYSDGKLVRNH